MVRLPAPFVPHSAILGPATATRVLSAPVPISTPPTGLDECLFFISLVPFYFLSVLVVRGGAVCLPTPPYWFSRPCDMNFNHCTLMSEPICPIFFSNTSVILHASCWYVQESFLLHTSLTTVAIIFIISSSFKFMIDYNTVMV